MAAQTTFTYLGSEVSESMDLDTTVSSRLAKASAAYGLLCKIWTSTPLPPKLKAIMYNTLVRPIALYGAETWTLLPSHEHLLDVQDMRWIRHFSGVTLEQQQRNEDIRERAGCPVPLSELCRQYRLRYYGHLCRMTSDRAPVIAMNRSAPGLRRQGHPHTSWKALVEADAATRGLTLADLEALAPKREEYREKVIHADRLDGILTRPRRAAPH